ncbi:aromatic ring-hydroxylating dioxygenase subunit alpha [Lichenibacterium minor]|uniref:Aromatic ring-hydroxylating dioxygenase subunit alpha n=1 Tax=Lichenibacterium minor TaxID=2316528 RepID=A0A4Q2U682_9HYPH|nr:aromatic ring-hydroxylating dioxygenase subunit alpha [Lichenibacterium minor]RYC32139.1 aromatic ring-hydroxylating dioxygenase subunit alpha [Lichenibacterium minor]
MSPHQTMLAAVEAHRPGYTLARDFYCDPAFFRLDLENIHHRDWLFAGHDCEIKRAGQFFTLQIGDYPVVVVRGNDGAIRAFHNSCRHRGSRVCTAEHGRAKRLVCPYHQWSYDLDGTLARARHMEGEIDKSQFGLKPVHCRSVGGYVFVCVGRDAPDWDAFSATVAPYLAPHDLSDTVVVHSSTIVENGNWKLVWENNRECFHCAANHPELCRSYPEAPTATGVDAVFSDPAMVEHWARCEAVGLPSRFAIADSGQYRVTRAPLIEGVESYTMSGRKAVKRQLTPRVTEPLIGTLLLFHYPTTWNHVLGDVATTFRVLPIDATHTEVTTKWLVNKDAVAGVDYDMDELTKVWLATNDQDRRVVEENQRGILSPAYEPGPYSLEHESGVMQFVDWYLGATRRALQGEPKLRRVA